MQRRDGFLRHWIVTCIGLAVSPGLTPSSIASAQTKADGGTPVSPASSARATPNAAWREKVDELYAQATQVSTVEGLESLKQVCQKLQSASRDAQTRQYLSRLSAWLYNRHGELLSQQAQDQESSLNEQGLAQLEQLAVAQFSRSIQLDPHYRALHNRGVSHAALGHYSEAIEDFEACLQLNPSYVNARFNRAELNLELGEFDAAERDYTGVLQENPADVSALIGRGHVRFYQGQFDESLTDFSDAIERDPENALAYADRADLYAYLGRWEEAARDYRTSIRLDRKLGRAYQSASWLMATCPDERFRDVELALRAAQRAIELDGPTDYRYLDTLAAAQANASQFDEAQKSARMAIQAAPEDLIPELTQRLAIYQAGRPYRAAQP